MGAEARDALGSKTAVSEKQDKQPRAKWRTTVAVSAGVATLVLASNIAFLAWVRVSFNIVGDVTVIYDAKSIPSSQ